MWHSDLWQLSVLDGPGLGNRKDSGEGGRVLLGLGVGWRERKCWAVSLPQVCPVDSPNMGGQAAGALEGRLPPCWVRGYTARALGVRRKGFEGNREEQTRRQRKLLQEMMDMRVVGGEKGCPAPVQMDTFSGCLFRCEADWHLAVPFCVLSVMEPPPPPRLRMLWPVTSLREIFKDREVEPWS